MRLVILSSLLVLSLLSSFVQMQRLRRARSSRSVVFTSVKAFSLIKRSFLAMWFASASALAIALQWGAAEVAVCLLAGFAAALGLELLTKSSGLMAFIEAGEEAMVARRAAIRMASNPGGLFLVGARGSRSKSKIVPARADWNALLQMRG